MSDETYGKGYWWSDVGYKHLFPKKDPFDASAEAMAAMVEIVKDMAATAKYGSATLEEGAEDVGDGTSRFLGNKRQEMLVWYPRNSRGGGYENNAAAYLLSYFNINDLLARFFITAHTQTGPIEDWRPLVIGCTSGYTGKNFRHGTTSIHMPMLDYDGKNVKKIIRKDVKLLQKKYDLGHAWVYETRRGFHVYFFCDQVSLESYAAMLEEVQCCKGFKRAFRERGGYSVLRVSAKYTDFDIAELYVLASRTNRVLRMTHKAHTIRALIALGQQCGTHLASMFPQWAHFHEDPKEWKPPTKKTTAKRIRKAYKKVGKATIKQDVKNEISIAYDGPIPLQAIEVPQMKYTSNNTSSTASAWVKDTLGSQWQSTTDDDNE
jgi:hypothetical protein